MQRNYPGIFGGSPSGKRFLFIELMVKYQACPKCRISIVISEQL